MLNGKAIQSIKEPSKIEALEIYVLKDIAPHYEDNELLLAYYYGRNKVIDRDNTLYLKEKIVTILNLSYSFYGIIWK